MTLRNAPPSSRWQWPLVGALTVGLAACDGTVSVVGVRGDGAVTNDITASDGPGTPDGSDVPATPDGAAPDALDGAAPDAPDASTMDAPDAPTVPDVPVVPDVPAPDAPDVRPMDVVDVPIVPDVRPPDAADVVDVPDAPLTLTTRVVVDCATVCQRPLDAVPDAMGRNVFFTAFTPTGEPAVFRAAVGTAPATPTMVATGMGMEFPLGITISHDDSTLYVVDQSADRGPDEASLGVGNVFSIPAAGGMVRVLNVGTELVHPTAVSITADGLDLLITGQQRDAMGDLRHALFRVVRTGASATVVNATLGSPGGVSQGSAGNIVVFETRRGGPRSGSVVTVTAGALMDVATGLAGGFPAGASLALDSRSALLAGANPEVGDGLLTWVGPDGRATAPTSLSMGMVAPQGLHRARLVDTWAVADDGAGENGRVFIVVGMR